MPLWISIGIIVGLLVVMWVAFAKEPGPAPADVAIAYENAWDRLDFDLLYDLSGSELRDGLRREQFVLVKQKAYAASGNTARLNAQVAVDDVDTGVDDHLPRADVVAPDESRAPGGDEDDVARADDVR